MRSSDLLVTSQWFELLQAQMLHRFSDTLERLLRPMSRTTAHVSSAIDLVWEICFIYGHEPGEGTMSWSSFFTRSWL